MTTKAQKQAEATWDQALVYVEMADKLAELRATNPSPWIDEEYRRLMNIAAELRDDALAQYDEAAK
jgi:hypothetical protein